MVQLDQYVHILKNMENTKYYMHEKYLCRAILCINNSQSFSSRQTLTKILNLIKKGNIPKSEGKRWFSPIGPIQNMTNEKEPNEISLWYRDYGSKESFPTSRLSTSQGRRTWWQIFSPGTHCGVMSMGGSDIWFWCPSPVCLWTDGWIHSPQL